MSSNIKTLDELRDSQLLYDKKIPAFGVLTIWVILVFILIFIFWSVKTPRVYVIKANGIVESPNKAYVMSSYGGRIKGMKIKEGSMVEQGQELFTVASDELNMQYSQLEGQRNIYENQEKQFLKLAESIKQDKNLFSASSAQDSLYYSQYEAYKSLVEQQTIDTNALKGYGYTDAQIEGEIAKNNSKISEIYYLKIKEAQESAQQAKIQLDSINAQIKSFDDAKDNYVVKANVSGIIHMLGDFKEGMVVQPSTSIASISQGNDDFIIKANVSVNDIPKLQVNNNVKMVALGLNQSVYGHITGRVENIDTDITMPQSSGGDEQSQPYFSVRITPNDKYLVDKTGYKVNLFSGMVIESRIEYDRETYFNYFLELLGMKIR